MLLFSYPVNFEGKQLYKARNICIRWLIHFTNLLHLMAITFAVKLKPEFCRRKLFAKLIILILFPEGAIFLSR